MTTSMMMVLDTNNNSSDNNNIVGIEPATISSTICVRYNRLEIDGPLLGGREEIEILQKVMTNKAVNHIRFFNFEFGIGGAGGADTDSLNSVSTTKPTTTEEECYQVLEELVCSRTWERVIIFHCGGALSQKYLRGLLQTNKLEVYGSIMSTTTQQQDQHNLLEAISEGLANNSLPIQFLRLRTRLDQDSIQPLSQSLATNQRLADLYLTCEFTDAESVELLAMGLRKNQHLKTLSLYSCEMSGEGSMETLLRALQEHPSLTTLELRDNNCLATAALAALVRQTKTLQHLAVYHPPHFVENLQIPRMNVESFAVALQQNASLKSLNLSSNGLHAGSAMWLSMALQINTSLETLNLQGNLIPDRGMESFGQALPNMKSLKRLYLWNNPFTGVGARALLKGLKSNDMLEEITTFSKFRCSDELQFYTHLNKAGRRILHDAKGIPESLWPIILGRVNKQPWEVREQSSILYKLLRHGAAAFL